MSLQSIGGMAIPGAGQVSPGDHSKASASVKTGGAADVAGISGPVQPPSEGQLKHAVSDLQKAVAPLAQDLQFSIDKESGRTVVKVVDAATDKVLKQFPSEEALAMSQSIGKFQQGLLLKQKA